MSILETVLQYKQAEEAKKMADINAMGTALNNFIGMKQQAEDRQLNKMLQMKNMENIDSQIAERNKPNVLNDFIKPANEVIDYAQKTGNKLLYDNTKSKVNQLLGIPSSPVEAINQNLDPKAQVSQAAAVAVGGMQQPQTEDQFVGETDWQGNKTARALRAEDSIQLEAKKKEKDLEVETATKKETALNQSKVSRLGKIIDLVESEFAETKPYKAGAAQPVLGAFDIAKKGLGATEAQRKDQAYASFVNGIRAQLARAMGEVGNLAQQEQEAVLNLLPTLMDSEESAKEKITNLRAFIKTMSGDAGQTKKEVNNDPLGIL